MKVYCDKCNGSGIERYIQMVAQTQFTGVFNGVNTGRKCEHCNGKGYTESPETQRLAEIGIAAEKAFECGYISTFDDIWTLGSIDELLEWHKEAANV